MKSIWALLLALIMFPGCYSEPKADTFTYTITPIHTDSLNALQIEFLVTTDANGIATLTFDNNMWGQENLFNTLRELQSEPATSVEFKPDENQITLTGEPETVLKVSYQSVKDSDLPLDYRTTYRPIIEETYFQSFGSRFLIHPASLFQDSTRSVEIAFNWNVPEDYIIHSSFGPKPQKIDVFRGQLVSSVFVGGDFRRYDTKIEGNDVYFLTRGKWKPFKDEEVNDVLRVAIETQRDFFEDHSDSIFSVTLLPTERPDGYSVSGTSLENSFASFASNNHFTELWRMKYLYFHELLHHWIGGRIQNQNEEEQYWFSEGFTDYYTYKLMHKAGEIDSLRLRQLLIEEVINPHYRSRVREVANSHITYERFWSDQEYSKLPYRRGAIYALYLDDQLKRIGSSLDDIMKEILAETEMPGFRLSNEYFDSLVASKLGSAASTEFQQFIIEGKTIPPGALPLRQLLD